MVGNRHVLTAHKNDDPDHCSTQFDALATIKSHMYVACGDRQPTKPSVYFCAKCRLARDRHQWRYEDDIRSEHTYGG